MLWKLFEIFLTLDLMAMETQPAIYFLSYYLWFSPSSSSDKSIQFPDVWDYQTVFDDNVWEKSFPSITVPPSWEISLCVSHSWWYCSSYNTQRVGVWKSSPQTQTRKLQSTDLIFEMEFAWKSLFIFNVTVGKEREIWYFFWMRIVRGSVSAMAAVFISRFGIRTVYVDVQYLADGCSNGVQLQSRLTVLITQKL